MPIANQREREQVARRAQRVADVHGGRRVRATVLVEEPEVRREGAGERRAVCRVWRVMRSASRVRRRKRAPRPSSSAVRSVRLSCPLMEQVPIPHAWRTGSRPLGASRAPTRDCADGCLQMREAAAAGRRRRRDLAVRLRAARTAGGALRRWSTASPISFRPQPANTCVCSPTRSSRCGAPAGRRRPTSTSHALGLDGPWPSCRSSAPPARAQRAGPLEARRDRRVRRRRARWPGSMTHWMSAARCGLPHVGSDAARARRAARRLGPRGGGARCGSGRRAFLPTTRARRQRLRQAPRCEAQARAQLARRSGAGFPCSCGKSRPALTAAASDQPLGRPPCASAESRRRMVSPKRGR